MIESVYKEIHNTGIIKILINTEDKWIDYQINRKLEEHKLVFSYFYSIDIQHGCFKDYEEEIEYIDMHEDFDPFDYMIYSFQEKEQITLILIPRKLLLDKQDWKEY